MSKTFAFWIRCVAPVTVPLLTMALMARDAARDPGPTGLPGDLPYWHNLDGDLRNYVRLVVLEALVVYFILRPWSYRRSRGRAIAALLLALPWMVFFGFLMIHSGGIMVLHFLWLVVACVFLGVLTVRSGFSATVQQSATRDAVAS